MSKIQCEHGKFIDWEGCIDCHDAEVDRLTRAIERAITGLELSDNHGDVLDEVALLRKALKEEG